MRSTKGTVGLREKIRASLASHLFGPWAQWRALAFMQLVFVQELLMSSDVRSEVAEVCPAGEKWPFWAQKGERPVCE